jgi:flagellar basal body-associated protein FliL
MISLKREDNIEAIVEHELDDPGNEEIAEITGHELDEAVNEESEEVTGHELDEPGDEESAELTGDELDEPGDEESAELTGDELDEPGDEESKAYKEEKNKSKGTKKKSRGKKTLSLLFMIGICLLAGGSYYFIQNKNEKEIISRVNIFPIPQDKSFIFESFILPIQKKQGYTYISLNLLLELSNIKLKGEIVEKKEQLRGIIYDILEQEIHRVEDADALEKLKTLIIKRANTVLTSGEVREAIINNLLLV